MLGQLGELWLDAAGTGGSDDPSEALEDAVRSFAPNHLMIALRPTAYAGCQEEGLLERIRQRFGLPMTGLPVAGCAVARFLSRVRHRGLGVLAVVAARLYGDRARPRKLTSGSPRLLLSSGGIQGANDPLLERAAGAGGRLAPALLVLTVDAGAEHVGLVGAMSDAHRAADSVPQFLL